MRVVDAGEMDRVIAAHDRFALIEQDPNTDRFEPRHHQNRIVVAEDGIGRLRQTRAQPRQSVEGSVERSVCLAAEVAGQNAEIAAQARQQLGELTHRVLAHIDMHVADMEDREPIEGFGEVCEAEDVFLHLHLCGVGAGTPVQPDRFQRAANQRRRGMQIPDAECREPAAL